MRHIVILFGKAYVWCTHDGKLTLHPADEPGTTAHAALESLTRWPGFNR